MIQQLVLAAIALIPSTPPPPKPHDVIVTEINVYSDILGYRVEYHMADGSVKQYDQEADEESGFHADDLARHIGEVFQEP